MDCDQNLPPPRFLSISQILISPIPRKSPPCFRSIPGSWSLVFWILMGWVTSGHLVCSEHCQKIAAVTKLQKRLPHAIQRISKLRDYSSIFPQFNDTKNLVICGQVLWGQNFLRHLTCRFAAAGLWSVWLRHQMLKASHLMVDIGLSVVAWHNIQQMAL